MRAAAPPGSEQDSRYNAGGLQDPGAFGNLKQPTGLPRPSLTGREPILATANLMGILTMSNFNLMGLLSWAGGCLLLVFQGISSLTNEKEGWNNRSLEDLMEPGTFAWIDDMTAVSLANAADYLVTMPFYIVLFVAGLLFFVMGMIFDKH